MVGGRLPLPGVVQLVRQDLEVELADLDEPLVVPGQPRMPERVHPLQSADPHRPGLEGHPAPPLLVHAAPHREESARVAAGALPAEPACHAPLDLDASPRDGDSALGRTHRRKSRDAGGYRTGRMARILVGTSGYLYRHWRNVLY